ncbi:hypothetical protein WJX73_005539 [Symbiochloris irregularis]|uniref:Uncharacterized protein n=1 Tax=Symbiochloris irregularis TaxID=706552 RepID=A0AAW1PUY3_9CHLO
MSDTQPGASWQLRGVSQEYLERLRAEQIASRPLLERHREKQINDIAAKQGCDRDQPEAIWKQQHLARLKSFFPGLQEGGQNITQN